MPFGAPQARNGIRRVSRGDGRKGWEADSPEIRTLQMRHSAETEIWRGGKKW